MCVDFIRKTSESLKLQIQVTQMDALKYLSAVKTQFDLIFADPPYDSETQQYIEIIETVFANQLIDRQGLLIIEHSEQEKFEQHPRFSQSRRYSSNFFSFFEE